MAITQPPTRNAFRLNRFLVRAKRKTYAIGVEPVILEDNFKELTYREGDIIYRDRFTGITRFMGHEVVSKKGIPIWGMNYSGNVFSSSVDFEQLYEFLRKVMNLVTEKAPFRGPTNYQDGDFEYLSLSGGNIRNFTGLEMIMHKEKAVYRSIFDGGIIKR